MSYKIQKLPCRINTKLNKVLFIHQLMH